MSAPASVPQQQPDPAQHVMQVGSGYLASISLNIAIRLGIPDLLAAGPRTVSELAQQTTTYEDALYRMLRALASVGVFTESAPRTFANTPPSNLLRTGVEGSLRDAVLWWCDPFHFRIYSEFLHSIRTGQPTADKVLGMPIFDYFPTDPKESEEFNNAMVSFSSLTVPAVLEAYDFSGIGTLVDVAGGHGGLLGPVLAKYPKMRGILTDLEHVLAGAKVHLERHGVAGRCTTVVCDFFKSVPAGGDAYVMKHIIHDWDDEKCLLILRNIATAMGGKKGKVILVEAVMPAGNEPHLVKFLDLEMLAMPGGRERTEAEYAALFERAGFRLTRVVPTKSPMSVIEAVRV
jgi:hypothetical protein